MKGCTPRLTAYAGEIVCDAEFLNPTHDGKYWLTPLNKGDRYITVRVQQVLLPNITMMKIDKKNKLSKRCNKKQVEKLGALIIRNDDIDELLEKRLTRDKFTIEFGIEDDIDYSEDTNGYYEGKVVKKLRCTESGYPRLSFNSGPSYFIYYF